jgi:hypothetical protein
MCRSNLHESQGTQSIEDWKKLSEGKIEALQSKGREKKV